MTCKVCKWANYPPCPKNIPCCDCNVACNSRQCEYEKKGGRHGTDESMPGLWP